MSVSKSARLVVVALFSAGFLSGCGTATIPDASQVKIVGGTVAPNRPFMAGLVERGQTVADCAGTFISPSVILTAAHCFSSNWTGLRVAGGHALNKDLSADKTVAVDDVVAHEGYSYSTNDNDIALVFLQTTELERFGERVKPAHNDEDIALRAAITSATVSGWGSLSFGGRFPDELREVTVPLVSNEQCKSASDDYNESITERQLCAGNWDDGGVDSCQGDSGGPLFVEKNGQTEVIGIVSWGEGCARKKRPGIYTRVSSYADWIKAKVAAHQRDSSDRT